MQRRLEDEGLLKVTLGLEIAPKDQVDKEAMVAYQKKARLAFYRLIKSLDDRQIPDISNLDLKNDDPHELWKALKRRHMSEVLIEQIEIFRKLNSLKYITHGTELANQVYFIFEEMELAGFDMKDDVLMALCLSHLPREMADAVLTLPCCGNNKSFLSSREIMFKQLESLTLTTSYPSRAAGGGNKAYRKQESAYGAIEDWALGKSHASGYTIRNKQPWMGPPESTHYKKDFKAADEPGWSDGSPKKKKTQAFPVDGPNLESNSANQSDWRAHNKQMQNKPGSVDWNPNKKQSKYNSSVRGDVPTKKYPNLERPSGKISRDGLNKKQFKKPNSASDKNSSAAYHDPDPSNGSKSGWNLPSPKSPKPNGETGWSNNTGWLQDPEPMDSPTGWPAQLNELEASEIF
ncbi:hypothetical protein O181_024090 [Austropuccinia psidii MF-1]|uniref:Uncharacterized protein n=1 Tax=Austropuccinia psidii MF-1 TaxID=1389203 RepID=A0A9Q3GZR5_9BASI|nr:hypothetical protein [Austropuccinia psidii MF-1]